MLSGNEIVLPVRKWNKVAKRIIEIIAPSGLHLDIKMRPWCECCGLFSAMLMLYDLFYLEIQLSKI